MLSVRQKMREAQKIFHMAHTIDAINIDRGLVYRVIFFVKIYYCNTIN
jgi:hypothetical protein